MKKQSIWSDIIINNKEKCLKQDIKTDILIIGGGITGITAGLFLKDFKVTLIEQNIIGMGISSKSTGKLTFLQDEILLNIIKAHNEPTAYLYYLAQLDAIKLVVNTIKKYNINCDLTKNHGYVYTNDPKKLKKIKKLENFFQKYNIKYDIITNLPNKLPCLYGLRVNDTYVFNPVKYIIELKEIISNYITIYEHTKALTITFENNYYIIKTNSNIIKAKKVIVATHYPFFIKPGFLPFKSYISKSYVLAANENNHQKINAYSSTLPITSFRYYLNYFIYASSFKKKSNDNENHHDLINNYQQYFNHKITYIWSSQDIMTNDFLPYIGKVNNNLYWATGYNKWGLTNGSIGAKLLTDLIKNKPNKYTNLFKLKRKTSLNIWKNHLYSNYINIRNFIKSKLKQNKKNHLKTAYITKIKGQKVGIYIDESQKKHVVSNICPHFNCNLLFNDFAKTWDCPCHGSRFDIDGNVILGPSVYDIKLK